MALRLRVIPVAEAHIRAATDWWETNRPAAPGLLAAELERVFDLIVTQPGVGPVVTDVGFDEVRSVYLRRVRYHLYYRVRGDLVEVLALWHASRGEGPPVISDPS